MPQALIVKSNCLVEMEEVERFLVGESPTRKNVRKKAAVETAFGCVCG